MNRENNGTYGIRAASLAAALWVCSPLCATAQVDEPPTTLPGPVPEAVPPTPEEVAPIEEHKIDQFADAYLAIEKIHADAATQLETTSDPKAAHRVKADAEAQIIEAVEQSGLRLEEFNQIAELMAVDVELRNRVARKVEERRRI